jgi:integrase
VILTGVRISEPRKARWREIDFNKKLWNVPPEHLKTGPLFNKARAVPITKPMLAVLEEMQRRRTDPSPDALIFPSPYKPGARYWRVGVGRALEKVISNARKVNKWNPQFTSHKIKITPHGFRATIEAWADAYGYEPKLYERQFDHAPQGKVRQSYDSITRPDAVDPTIERRREMMEKWGVYCDRIEPPELNAAEPPELNAAAKLLPPPVANKELTT